MVSFIMKSLAKTQRKEVSQVLWYKKLKNAILLKNFFFSDRIFTFNCMVWMVGRCFYASIPEIRWVFGPVGYGLTSLRYYVNSSQLCIPLGIAESILFRCLMIFSWKKYAMINDEFLARFLFLFNFMIGQIISVVRLKIEDFEILFNEEYEFLSGLCYTAKDEKRYLVTI